MLGGGGLGWEGASVVGKVGGLGDGVGVGESVSEGVFVSGEIEEGSGEDLLARALLSCATSSL